jgi:hypothetical protein
MQLIAIIYCNIAILSNQQLSASKHIKLCNLLNILMNQLSPNYGTPCAKCNICKNQHPGFDFVAPEPMP